MTSLCDSSEIRRVLTINGYDIYVIYNDLDKRLRIWNPFLIYLGKNRKKPGKRAIITAAGGRCVYCNTTENLTIDHIIPLSEGGTNAASNLRILCDNCQKKYHGTDKPKKAFK